jgi:hypothetical protein
MVMMTRQPRNLTDRLLNLLAEYRRLEDIRNDEAASFLRDWKACKTEILEAFETVRGAVAEDPLLKVTVAGANGGPDDLASLTMELAAGPRRAMLEYKPDFPNRQVLMTHQKNGDTSEPRVTPLNELHRSFVDGHIENLLKGLLGF